MPPLTSAKFIVHIHVHVMYIYYALLVLSTRSCIHHVQCLWLHYTHDSMHVYRPAVQQVDTQNYGVVIGCEGKNC